MSTSSIVKRAFCFVTTAFALGAVVACSGAPDASSGASEPEGLVKDAPHVHAKSLCFMPEIGGERRTIARVTIASGDEHPSGFAVALHGHAIEVADDGVFPDETANDGVYAGITTTASKYMQQSTCFDTSKGIDSVARDPGALKPDFLGCTAKTVPCQEGCKSVIFRTRCLVCIEVSCG